jgi:uncharacterized membrane protein
VEEPAHLWAVGFDDTERAAGFRDDIAKLAERHCLALFDSAVAVRYGDGSTTLDGEPVLAPINLRGHGWASWFAALALGAPPLTATAVRSLSRGTASGSSKLVAIEDDFLREVGGLMQPGTSVLFVLGRATDADALLAGIRGLGGTVLKTSVDLETAKRIQSALSTPGDHR